MTVSSTSMTSPLQRCAAVAVEFVGCDSGVISDLLYLSEKMYSCPSRWLTMFSIALIFYLLHMYFFCHDVRALLKLYFHLQRVCVCVCVC